MLARVRQSEETHVRRSPRFADRCRDFERREPSCKTVLHRELLSHLHVVEYKGQDLAERVGFVRLREGCGGISSRQRRHPAVARAEFTRERRRMAERVGFEPTVEFPLHTLSKRAPSTTRTSLRFRINDLRAVRNRIAQNPPSRISDSTCPVPPTVCGNACHDE